jgi:hypothetical protein
MVNTFYKNRRDAGEAALRASIVKARAQREKNVKDKRRAAANAAKKAEEEAIQHVNDAEHDSLYNENNVHLDPNVIKAKKELENAEYSAGVHERFASANLTAEERNALNEKYHKIASRNPIKRQAARIAAAKNTRKKGWFSGGTRRRKRLSRRVTRRR